MLTTVEHGISWDNMWKAAFIQAVKRRKFPRFWEHEWLFSKEDPFFKEAQPPYFFIETIQKGVIQVWGIAKEAK